VNLHPVASSAGAKQTGFLIPFGLQIQEMLRCTEVRTFWFDSMIT